MADNKDKKVFKSSIEREQSQTCLNSAEREKIKGSTNLNVPHLRFPEFSGEWEEHTLSEYLEFKNGLNPDAKRIGNGLPFISVMDVLSEGVIRYDNIRGKVDATEKEIECFGVKNGDILFQRSSETLEDVGRANVYMDDRTAIYGGFVIRGRKIGNYDPMFFKFLLATPLARKSTCRMGAGAQHFNIGQEGLSKISLFFPHIEEQRKIASLLSLIDQRIATQNKIIEILESLIKGIIYQTKSIGLAHNTWQKTELKNVLQERNEKNANGYDVCSVSVTQGVVNQIEYLGRSFAAKDTLHYNVVKYGDIVYTKSPTGDFPYGIVKRSNIKCDVAVSPLYGVYKPVNDYVGIILHFYFMQSNNAINYLHPLIQKGAKNTINITNGRFLENTIPLPKKEEETKCLAWVLTSIQNKIILEQDLLHSYQKQKQYLLRQMFI